MLIPCPNGGQCGSRRHVPASQAYLDCLRAFQSGASSSALGSTKPPIPAVIDGQAGEVYILDSAFNNRVVQYNSDHIIDYNSRLDTDEIQMYLDGDSELYSTIHDDMQESIYNDVDNCLDVILKKVGIDPEYVDDDVREELISTVMSNDEADIVQRLAENTPQRFLRANNTTLDEAYENASGERGSAEWYDSISSAVWDRDVVDVMDWESPEQKAEDKKAFQEAFRDFDPDYIHEDMSVSLLWGGSITDAAPSFEGDKELSIYSPSFVFVDSYNGTFNNTDQLKGTARVIIPDARKDADLKHRIIDDESEGMYGSVYKMGGLNIDAFRSLTLSTKL